MNYPIENILFFIKVAEFETLKDAATSLDMAPSTIGRRISILEEELGEKLLITNRNGLTLTPFGQKLYHQFASYHYQMEQDVIDYLNEKGNLETSVNILLPFIAFNSLPPESIVQIINQYPGIQLNFNLYNGFDIPLTPDSEIDLILSYLCPDNPYFTAQIIASTTTKLYCNHEYIKRYGLPKTIDELITHQRRITSLTNTIQLTHSLNGENYLISKKPVITNLGVNPINYLHSGYFIIESGQGQKILENSGVEVLPEYNVSTYEVYMIKNQIRYNPLLDKIGLDLINIINSIFHQFNPATTYKPMDNQ